MDEFSVNGIECFLQVNFKQATRGDVHSLIPVCYVLTDQDIIKQLPSSNKCSLILTDDVW